MNKNSVYKSFGFPTREMYQFPNIVNVEVYRGDCPCRCVHCPVGIIEPERRKERFKGRGMDLNVYKKVVKEISKHPHATLRLHSTGEPLMWEKLVEAMELSHHMLVKSWIFTCGITKNRGLLESMCKNISIIEVSINSLSPEDYIATKGVDAFEKVVGNIKYMRNFIASKGLSTRLVVSRVETFNEISDNEFITYWKSSDLVDDAFVRSYHTYNRLVNDLYNKQPLPYFPKQDPCLVHWGRFNISVDGLAVICFNELFKERLAPSLILGDINQKSIVEIWHGHKLNSLRKAELNGDYSDLSFESTLPCKNCGFCQPLYGKRQTSEHQIKQLKME